MPLILRSQLSVPLTNAQLDGNFTYLKDLADSKLNQTDFTVTNILEELNSDSTKRGANSNLDVSLLRGQAPSTQNVANTIVQRDGSGNFYANQIIADHFVGEATRAQESDVAIKLKTPRAINGVNFDGSAAITVYDSTKLALTGGTLTGKLITDTPGSTNASLTLPHGSAPSSPVNGDVWSTTSGIFSRINGATKTLAFTDSNITGTAFNVTGVVTVAHGGTGATTADAARSNIGAAQSGVNNDITRLAALSTPLTAAQGGTGLSSPGNSGNFLRSTGSGWQSVAVDFNPTVPAGAVMTFAMQTPPNGWLECNGTAVSRTTYAALFAAIGTTYGAGNGSTTFNLPDLRGEFVRGWDHGRGVDQYRNLGTWQKGTLQLTDPNWGSHNVYSPIGRYNYAGGSNGPVDRQFTIEMGEDFIADGSNMYPNVMLTYSPYGGSTPIELGRQGFGYGATRPRNVALMYCIKY